MTGKLADKRKWLGEKTPNRTCIGCRKCEPRTQMVRLVAPEGTVIVAERYQPGRGAWIHKNPSCWGNAQKMRAFSRAFRKTVTVPEFASVIRKSKPVSSNGDLHESGLEADGHPMSTQR